MTAAARRVAAARRRPAFSLAELMIAIVILGLGLLFIAAALPVGIEYSRRNVQAAEAEAAAVYASQMVEQVAATSSQPLVAGGLRTDAIFRPREPVTGSVNNDHEPLIKVRPLTVRNIPVPLRDDNVDKHVVDAVEEVIGRYLQAVFGPAPPLEVDVAALEPLWQWPSAPAVSRVFPPVESIVRMTPADFMASLPGSGAAALGPGNANNYPRYVSRPDSYDQTDDFPTPGSPPHGYYGVFNREQRKASQQRLAWTAFYRRVEYPRFQVDANFNNPESAGAGFAPERIRDGDPLQYELIIIITERPTVRHRFPHQDLSAVNVNAFRRPLAVQPGDPPFSGSPPYENVGADRALPMPWLVVFKEVPSLVPPQWGPAQLPPVLPVERYIHPSVSNRPTLTFICEPELGRVLPRGSLLIPARNDYRPVAFLGVPSPAWVGFLPSAPDELPIYRVVDRPDETTVVVENNGFYPWIRLAPPFAGGPGRVVDLGGECPFWIIPPVFEERAGDGQPLYEDRSPIVKVIRKVVRLPEN